MQELHICIVISLSYATKNLTEMNDLRLTFYIT